MKSRRWLWTVTPAVGLAGLLIVGISAMQAQVGSEPKSSKVRPAERPAATEPAAPASKTEAARAAPPAEGRADDAARHHAPRDDHDREHQGRGWLGVYVSEPDERNPVSGAQISQIFPASPAARAGFRSGDVITQVNDQKVTDPQSFVTAIESMPPGTKAAISVQRNNQPFKLTATLGQNYWALHGQEDFGRDFENRRGRSAEDDIPFEALQLEHSRRMSEQHERLEQMILEVKEEVLKLREDLRAKK